METTSLENDFDTEKRTDWLYDNLPDLTKKLLHSKMLSKDLSEKHNPQSVYSAHLAHKTEPDESKTKPALIQAVTQTEGQTACSFC